MCGSFVCGMCLFEFGCVFCLFIFPDHTNLNTIYSTTEFLVP